MCIHTHEGSFNLDPDPCPDSLSNASSSALPQLLPSRTPSPSPGTLSVPLFSSLFIYCISAAMPPSALLLTLRCATHSGPNNSPRSNCEYDAEQGPSTQSDPADQHVACVKGETGIQLRRCTQMAEPISNSSPLTCAAQVICLVTLRSYRKMNTSCTGRTWRLGPTKDCPLFSPLATQVLKPYTTVDDCESTSPLARRPCQRMRRYLVA